MAASWEIVYTMQHKLSTCSGHGKFIKSNTSEYRSNVNVDSIDGYCQCQSGWTGRSDFVNAENVLCHVGIDAITTLWVLNIIFSFVLLALSVKKLRVLVNKYLEMKKKMRDIGKSYSITSNQGLLAICIFYLICSPFQIATGIIRIAAPWQRIGLDWAITITWIITRAAFYISSSTYQPALLAQTLKATNAADSVISTAYIVGYAITFWTILVSLLSIPILATGGNDIPLARACFVSYAVGQMTALLMYHFQARHLERKIEAILGAAYVSTSNVNHLALKERLISVQKETQKQTLAQSGLYLIVACFPYFWVCHDYILPLSWFTIPIMGYRLTNSMYESRNKDGSASSKNISNKATDGQQHNNNLQHNYEHLGAPNNHHNHPHQQNKRASATHAMSTVTSVMRVDEDNPALLATGNNWKAPTSTTSPITAPGTP